MSFEVFDDVAFYYLLQSVLAVFLVPWTIVKIIYFLIERLHKSKEPTQKKAKPQEYELTGTKIVDEKTFKQKYLTRKNILFLALWVLFAYQCLQLPQYLEKNLASYDPIDILGVPPDASEDDIKKAYKKLSLQWHPDKNPTNREEAELKFIEISKAYRSLTDPKAKANMRKFGNVDGFQGTSMTIGLPSFLTKGENSLKILLVYFLIMILIPPVGVFLWWRKAATVHETGIMRDTLNGYWHLLTEHMSPKFLIPIYCFSHEFRSLGVRDNSAEANEERKKLKVLVQEYIVKTPVSKLEYADRGHVLLLAYLLRIPIPEILQPDLKLLLTESHRLLSGLFQIAITRKFVKASMGCVELMQMITQAMWPSASPLLQVPFLTAKEIRMANRKKMDTMEGFKAADREKRAKVYPDHSEEEWRKIDEVCARIPDLALDCSCAVDDEEGIYENDIVTIKVTLERVKPGMVVASQSRKVPVEGEAEDTDDAAPVLTAPASASSELSLDNEELAQVDARERTLLRDLAVSKDKTDSKLVKTCPGVPVHSAFYPYEKKEQWIIMLFSKNKNKTLNLLLVNKVNDFADKEVIELRLKVGDKGVWPYELHAKCDSYVGCDVSLNFKITVAKMTKDQEERRDRLLEQSKAVGLDDDEDMEEPEPVARWYYGGFSSLAELCLNLAILGALCFFVVNFLQTRGYWDKYVTPIWTKVWQYIGPIVEPVLATVTPVLGPVQRASAFALGLLDYVFVAVDPEELIKAKNRFQAEL